MGMNFTESSVYEAFYLHLDHQVDAVDLIVLQNDHREPIVEVLVQLEGNTIQGDIQNAIGQPTPNWDTNRIRYASDGHLYYGKNQYGEIDRTQRVKMNSGLPKIQLVIFGCQERMHAVNVAKNMETIKEDKPEVSVRLLDTNRKVVARRKQLWRDRKEQINKHLNTDADVMQVSSIHIKNGRFKSKKY